MAILRTDALVLRAIDYSETSQIAWFFTRDFGRVHVLAKGARRARSPFEGSIEPLVHGEIVFYRKKHAGQDEPTLDILKELDARDAFPGIRHDLARHYRGAYVAELLRELSFPDDPLPQLFDAAIATLETLARGPARVLDAVLAAFEVRALRASGLEPALDFCAECGQKLLAGDTKTIPFGPLAGGALCRPHRRTDAHAFDVSRPALYALSVLAKDDRPRGRFPFGPELVREVRRVLDAFIAHRLGKQLHLSRYVAVTAGAPA